MSCDAAALALTLRLASFDLSADAPRLIRAAASAPQPSAANPLAREPLFASIVAGAGRLRDRVDGLRKAADAPSAATLSKLEVDADALAALDMKGHTALAARGTDGDLKCILKGIAQDMPRKLGAVRAAAPDRRRAALDELWFLLRDNVEVITAPPQPAV